MPKFKFAPEDLRRCFAIAKIVKPQTNDLCLRFASNRLILFSADKRRFVRAETFADPLDKIPDGYISDDFYITVDRTALFDSDLDSVTINVNDKSLSIHTHNSEQIRQATLKKRSTSSRRPPIPPRPVAGDSLSVSVSDFDLLLKQVSCSAMVRETKTEEDMRINQVHFYKDQGCAISNARYYGSIAFLPTFRSDISLVSNDVPIVKGFLAKCGSDSVSIFQDSARLYLEDPRTGSVLALSKVNGNRPPLSVTDRSKFRTLVVADQEKLAQSLEWALLALEGTQRVSVRTTRSTVDGKEGNLELQAGNQELSKIPISIIEGDGIQGDFPARFLASIIRYIGGGEVAIRYGHPDAPTILELSQHPDRDPVRAYHYLQGMKERK